MKRFLLAAGGLVMGLFFLIALAAVTGPLWQREWAPPDNGVSLTPKRPLLKAEEVRPESAFDLLRRAAEKVSEQKPSEEFRAELRRLKTEPWSNERFPLLADALGRSEEALDLARRAAAAPDPQVPSTLWLATPFPYLTPMMRIGGLFCASACRRLATGDVSGAMAELETARRFAAILSRGGVLIHLLVQMAIDARVCEMTRAIARRYDVSAEGAAGIAAQLLQEGETAEPLADVYREETRSFPKTTALFFQTPSSALVASTPDSEDLWAVGLAIWLARNFTGGSPEMTTANREHVYQEIVGIAEEPYSAANAMRLHADLTYSPTKVDWFLTRDPVGLFLSKDSAPMFETIATRYYAHLADLRATAVMVALDQFERDRGAQAQSLAELVPDYLARVPLDPFDGKELRYHKRGPGESIVYSVGPNQIDEGGLDKKARSYRDEGDVVFGQDR